MKQVHSDKAQGTQSKVRKRPAGERGQGEHGWLHARFTFSFADYFDPNHMGFQSLRVMNNDVIEPGGGFPTHAHSNTEIFTYVISGSLEHRDSLGNGSVITPGNLQYMSAASGIRHSEFNPSKTERTELYQIWLTPNQTGGEPRYAEVPLGDDAAPNALKLLFSGDGREGSTAIRQTADVYFGKVEAGKQLVVPAATSTPHAWIQIIQGAATVLGTQLEKADGLAIEETPKEFVITAREDTRLLAFRLGKPAG